MSASACRIEHVQIAWVFLRAWCKLLSRLAHHVLAPLCELSLRAAHLVPDAPECVVCEELDDISRREELIADSQLSAVARGLTLLAHLATFILPIEKLVDPADRLVFAPDPD